MPGDMGRDLGVLVSPGIGSSGPRDGGGGGGVGGERDGKAERGGARWGPFPARVEGRGVRLLTQRHVLEGA